MVEKQVRPKTTPGVAPRGNLTFVAIAALVVAALVFIMAVVRPMLHPTSQPQGQGGAPAVAGSPGSSS